MIRYKTRYPFNVYFLAVAVVSQAIYTIDLPIGKCLFYLLLTFLFLYILFSRNACRIKIYDDKIIIEYVFFWDKKIVVPLGGVVSVDYGKSFYDLASDKTISGLYVFPKYCYDILKLHYQGGTVKSIDVNTSIFSFDKTVRILKTFLDIP